MQVTQKMIDEIAFLHGALANLFDELRKGGIDVPDISAKEWLEEHKKPKEVVKPSKEFLLEARKIYTELLHEVEKELSEYE